MIPMLLFNLLVTLKSVVTLTEAIAPVAPTTAEPVIYTTSLRLRERVWRWRGRLLLFALALAIGLWTGWLVTLVALFILTSLLGLLSQPLRLTVTVTGLALNGARHPWSAFDTYTVEDRHLQLQGFETWDIWLAPDQVAAVVAALPPRIVQASTLGRPLTAGETLRRLASLVLEM